MKGKTEALYLGYEELDLFVIDLRRFFTPIEKQIVLAIALGNLEELPSLFSHPDVNRETMVISIRACVMFGQLKPFQNLSRFIPRISIPGLLDIAAENGHFHLVNYILGHYKLGPVHTYRALRLAAAQGHLEVVNCMIKDHQIHPNQSEDYLLSLSEEELFTTSANESLDLTEPKANVRCEPLYDAVFAGQIDVVLSLLNDSRTGYFSPEKKVYNSHNEKAFIIAVTTLSKTLINKNIEPSTKRKMLLAIASKLISRNQQNDLKRLFEIIEPTVKVNLLFTSYFRKKTPDEMVEGQLDEFFNGPDNTLVHLLIESQIERVDDCIKINFNKFSKIYFMYVTGTRDLIAEMIQYISTLGYTVKDLDMDSLIFNPESSIALKTTYCIHYNATYLNNLVSVQRSLQFYYKSFESLMHGFWIQMPKEIWNYIVNFFVRLMHFNLTEIDPSDIPFLFMVEHPDPTQFLLPQKNGEPQTVLEIPLGNSDAKNLPHKIDLFKVIYKALYAGQSSFFKLWNSKLMDDKSLKDEKKITDYIKLNPESRTAKAWDFTNRFINSDLSKKELFTAIHRQAYKNSSNFGIFKQSVFENGYQQLEKQLEKAKNGNELKGTRTKDIVDVLNSNSSLRL